MDTPMQPNEPTVQITPVRSTLKALVRERLDQVQQEIAQGTPKTPVRGPRKPRAPRPVAEVEGVAPAQDAQPATESKPRKPRKPKKKLGRPVLPSTLIRRQQIRERRKYRAKMRKAKTASAAAFHARVAANKAAREERSKRWAQELERRRIKREQEALLEAQSPAGQRKARRISKLRAEITNEIYTSVFAAGKEAGRAEAIQLYTSLGFPAL